MNYKYLIDANVLSMGRVSALITSDFFRDKCIVLEEISHELRDTSLFRELATITTPASGGVLPYISQVADEIIKLGMLKTDEGNGEVILLAWALMIRESSNGQIPLDFMRETPVVVSNETKVVQYAKSKSIDSITGKEFIAVLEQRYE